METIAKIEKEQIPSLRFMSNEVLEEKDLQTRRKVNLSKALTLGNGDKRKVKIYFILEDGTKNVVETTVWSVGQDFVTLKAGALIPVHAITEVEF